MKNLVWTIALVLLSSILCAQKSIDALFDKYNGVDGYTVVTINGNLLKLAAALDEDKESGSIPKDITLIRILTQEDGSVKSENFYDFIVKDLDLKQYEEFMQVKSKDQNMKMLVRIEGDRFKEFLLIVGGDDNAVIQIKGNMSLSEAKKFAEETKKDHGMHMAKN